MNEIAQLPLPVSLPVGETFATWVSGDNGDALAMLQASEAPLVYLWGPRSVGKTHVLHALCAAYPRVCYVPLAELSQQVDAGFLRGLEHYDWICLDDLEAVSGDADWCFELFSLFNRIYDRQQGKLVLTAQVAPSLLPVQLADLQSRLQWGLTLQLKPLHDEQKALALQVRAKALGLQLTAETAQYMVQRLGRDMASLTAALNQLDAASIAAKRRLTTPFVRTILQL